MKSGWARPLSGPADRFIRARLFWFLGALPKRTIKNEIKIGLLTFSPALFMNYRYGMFKYQEIQSTADKMDAGNNGLFSNPFY